MIENLANGYSSESTQQVLSNEYQHDRVEMVFKNIHIFILWTKVVSALEGLRLCLRNEMAQYGTFWNDTGL